MGHPHHRMKLSKRQAKAAEMIFRLSSDKLQESQDQVEPDCTPGQLAFETANGQP
jgi:hypothetical protein